MRLSFITIQNFKVANFYQIFNFTVAKGVEFLETCIDNVFRVELKLSTMFMRNNFEIIREGVDSVSHTF